MTFSKITISLLAAGFLASTAATAVASIDTHIGINVVDGQLTTQGWLGGTGYLGEKRVFTGVFDPDNFATGSPGTNSVGGTFATPGAIGFNILNELLVWNGAGFSSTSETMTIAFGPESATTDAGFVSGFATNVRDENSHPGNENQWGRHHIHHDWILNGDGGNPNDGIYLLELELYYEAGAGNDTSYANSKNFYMVFGLNSDESQILGVADWVQINMIPAPGALALLALAGLAGCSRRRHV
jgi:hypothetical protein